MEPKKKCPHCDATGRNKHGAGACYYCFGTGEPVGFESNDPRADEVIDFYTLLENVPAKDPALIVIKVMMVLAAVILAAAILIELL